MAYAEAAGLPAVNGLYASVLPMIFYAIFGPSRVAIVGPDSSLAPMIAAALLPLAGRDPAHAVALAGACHPDRCLPYYGRILRLGFVTGLLSKPIRVGYLNGIVLAVMASQLPRLLGISIRGNTLPERLAATADVVFQGGINPVALGFGAGTVAVMIAGRLLPWRVPGVLLAGVDDVLALVAPAAGIALIAFADTSTLSKSLAGRRRLKVSGNQEMGALGIANVASGLLGGFPVCGSSSRTPIALDAGHGPS